jgi:hypothetical protein
VFHVCSVCEPSPTRAVSTLFPLFPVFLGYSIYGNDEGIASIEVRIGNPERWELKESIERK